MIQGAKIEVYIDTDNPRNVKAANYLYAIAETLFIVASVFLGIILIVILPIYIKKRIKEK